MQTINPANPATNFNEWIRYIYKLNTMSKTETKILTAQDLYDELNRLLQIHGTLNVPIDGWFGREHYELHTLETSLEGEDIYRLQINLTK